MGYLLLGRVRAASRVLMEACMCTDAEQLIVSQATRDSSAVKVLVNFVTTTGYTVSELGRDLVN